MDSTRTAHFALIAVNCRNTDRSRIRAALQRLGFEDVIMDDDGTCFRLPEPLMAGEFMAESPADCRRYLLERVQARFADGGIQARVLLVVSPDYRMSCFGTLAAIYDHTDLLTQ